ncbi:hypothetical protein [Deferribacter autotrophicus]|nr:hypothetical protein [Deferribacter autotrophicus]
MNLIEIKKYYVEDFILSIKQGRSAKTVNNFLIPFRRIFEDAFD